MLSFYLDLVPNDYNGLEVARLAQENYAPSEYLLEDDIEELLWAEMKKSDTLPDFVDTYTGVVNKFCADLMSKVLPDADIRVDDGGYGFLINDKLVNSETALLEAVKQAGGADAAYSESYGG